MKSLAVYFGRTAQLHHSRIPITKALPEPLRLSDDDRHVGPLNFAARLLRLSGHELPDAKQNLHLHGQDLNVDLPPVERLLKVSFRRGPLAVHCLRPIAPAPRSIDIRPRRPRLDLGHGPQVPPPT